MLICVYLEDKRLKKTHAIWEKRNLGQECWEFEVELNDSVELVSRELNEVDATYLVVKVPVNMFEVNNCMIKNGFSFVETIIKDHHDLKKVPIDKLQRRIYQSIITSGVDSMEDIYREIDRGIFLTDRISVDPFFSTDQVAHRYKNWIEQEVENGAIAFQIHLKEKVIGFNVLKKVGSVYDLFLGGLYKDYLKSGLGMFLMYSAIDKAIELNGKMLKSCVSSNNVGALKVHMQVGFAIDDVKYVFVRHQ